VARWTALGSRASLLQGENLWLGNTASC
jgi:hypothetical protein